MPAAPISGPRSSVRVGDETVVDLWGGSADAAGTRPWVEGTIVNVYSTTKTMTALTALLLADRGLIDFDAPVAKYWPEFAAGGKSRVTVAQIMSHSSGLSGWREKVTKQDLYDWERAVALLAAQEPFWEPGTASGYHAVTMGFLVGEVVRRVTGKALGTVFREEIAQALGADFWIGLPASEDHRVAELIPPPPGQGLDANLDSLNEIQKNWIVNPLFSVDDSKTRAGAPPSSAPRTGRAMPAPSRWSIPSWPMAASPRASASCRKPAAARRWSFRWKHRSHPVDAAARRPGFRSRQRIDAVPQQEHDVLGRLMAARSRSSTWRTACPSATR